MGYASERFRQQRISKHRPAKSFEVSWGFAPHLNSMTLGLGLEPAQTENNPSLKGKLNGNCNREACQAPNAVWWNTSTRAYYCGRCARDINRACEQFGEPIILFPSAGAEADAAMKYGDQR